MSSTEVTGTQFNYYFICRRKLWLFSRGINLERQHENVALGSFIHETTFKNKKKEIQIGPVKIDFMDHSYQVVHEIKKSSRMQESAVWQLKYYLYYLKKYGIQARGVIHIPEENKREEILLNEEDEKKITGIIMDINNLIMDTQIPAVTSTRVCRKCAYFEFCFAE